MAPDVNVLVAAFMTGHPHHAAARAWLTEALEACSRGGSLQLLPMVAAGFARLVTNPKVFPGAVTAREAHGFIRSIMRAQGVTMLTLGPEWNAFEKLCIDLDLVGPRMTDGWIAAAIKANGLRLVTFDRDFSRLLDSSECLLLQPGTGVQERRGTYSVRRMPTHRSSRGGRGAGVSRV